MERTIHPATCTCGPVCMRAAFGASSDRTLRRLDPMEVELEAFVEAMGETT